jgi:hypothetical protein
MSTVGESSIAGERRALALATPQSKPVDDNEVVEDDGIGQTIKSSGKTPVDGKKLEEISEMFQSQLEFQQRQLDLLRGLTKTEEAPAHTRTPTFEDCVRAVKWMEERSPEIMRLKELGKGFIVQCRGRGVLWFSRLSLMAKSKDFVSTYGELHKLEPQNYTEFDPTLLMQRLL